MRFTCGKRFFICGASRNSENGGPLIITCLISCSDIVLKIFSLALLLNKYPYTPIPKFGSLNTILSSERRFNFLIIDFAKSTAAVANLSPLSFFITMLFPEETAASGEIIGMEWNRIGWP